MAKCLRYTTKRSFSTLKIYGATDKRNQIEPMLSWVPAKDRPSATAPSQSSVRPYEPATSYAPYATPEFSGYDRYDSRTSGYGAQASSALAHEASRKQQEEFARAAELKQMLASLEKVNDDNRRTSLLDTLCSTEDVLNLPEHPNPPGIASGELRVDLLRHQVCGLPLALGIYGYSMIPYVDRSKHCCGQSSTKTQDFQPKKKISLCSSGSTERQAPRCVQFPSRK
jgi:SWI/SNF-related matrix-associated actin-dependent regulator of chromatin subfamily A3